MDKDRMFKFFSGNMELSSFGWRREFTLGKFFN
jgi:hypothetical protein